MILNAVDRKLSGKREKTMKKRKAIILYNLVQKRMTK